jgi:hypothetical protein
MASPEQCSIFAWNGLDTITPRLEDSRPPQEFTDLHRVRYAMRPYLYPFLPRHRVRCLLSDGVRLRVWQPKRKTPNGFGGLDPWRWAILESVRLTRWENLPIPRPHKPTKNIGGVVHRICGSNGCHTVSTCNSARNLPPVSIKTQKSPKLRETT